MTSIFKKINKTQLNEAREYIKTMANVEKTRYIIFSTKDSYSATLYDKNDKLRLCFYYRNSDKKAHIVYNETYKLSKVLGLNVKRILNLLN